MDLKYIDAHSHLNFTSEYPDLDEVIQRMEDTETGTIVVGTDLESSKCAVELADKYENIWACIGVHPVDDQSATFEVDRFEDLVKHQKVVVVGECGLDFFHADKEADFERQKDLFLEQVNFTLKHDKPIMIHVRDAYEELLEIIEPMKVEHEGKLRGNVHFFASDVETAKRFWNIGFTTSFTGVITFPSPKNKVGTWADSNIYVDVIKSAPLEMILSETDAPFVAPVPHRGKRNEPSYVSEVVKRIAEIRDEDPKKVRETLITNAVRVFNILD